MTSSVSVALFPAASVAVAIHVIVEAKSVSGTFRKSPFKVPPSQLTLEVTCASTLSLASTDRTTVSPPCTSVEEPVKLRLGACVSTAGGGGGMTAIGGGVSMELKGPPQAVNSPNAKQAVDAPRRDLRPIFASKYN